MAKIFELTDDIKQVAADAIDDLIEALGKACTLVYPPIEQDCDNCIYDSINKRSANIYQQGGPIPFTSGEACPKCGGEGVIVNEPAYEVVKLLCNWNPKDFQRLDGELEVPYSIVRTKGHVEDLPKIIRSQYMILQSPPQAGKAYKFVRASEPIDRGNIIQNRYFVCFWKREG